jgi:hypothetical protein
MGKTLEQFSDGNLEQVDLATAATRRGTTPDALRKKIMRGTQQARKINRQWYITLPREPKPPVDNTPSPPPDMAILREFLNELVRQLCDGQQLLVEEFRQITTCLQHLEQRVAEQPIPHLWDDRSLRRW